MKYRCNIEWWQLEVDVAKYILLTDLLALKLIYMWMWTLSSYIRGLLYCSH